MIFTAASVLGYLGILVCIIQIEALDGGYYLVSPIR